MSGTLADAPRAQVLDSGTVLPGLIGASVTTNSYYHAGSFALLFAASAQAGMWWDREPPWVLDTQLSTDGASFTTMITGEVDEIEYDPAAGTVHMTGRDFIAAMIESKTQETFQNQTSSQIVQTIAARHGLTADVTATTTLAGTFYQQDHTRLSQGSFTRVRTEWDILVYLAQQEGFDLWVQGRTIYFQPQRTQTSPDFTVAFVGTDLVAANVERATFSRAYTLAKDIEVEVISWNSRTARQIKRTARAIKAKVAAVQPASNQVGVQTQRYVFRRPNLTGDQAQQYAQTMLEQISRHERNASFEMVGELTLTPRSQIAVTGTGTTFDQTYWVDSIERRIDMGGFRQSLHLKNHSPVSEVALS